MPEPNLSSRHKEWNGLLYRYKAELLMTALVAEIMFSPYTDLHPHVGGFAALSVLGLVIALFSYAAPTWLVRFVLVPLAVIWTIARLLEAGQIRPLESAQFASVFGLGMSLAFLGLMLHRFTAVSQSSASVMAEAFITYLIIAICFSQIYEIVDRTTLHAFNKVVPAPRGSTMMYFSMVNLSSLGSGDLIPMNPYLRIAAAFESMIGLFYIAVVVARLVSSSRASRDRSGI